MGARRPVTIDVQKKAELLLKRTVALNTLDNASDYQEFIDALRRLSIIDLRLEFITNRIKAWRPRTPDIHMRNKFAIATREVSVNFNFRDNVSI